MKKLFTWGLILSATAGFAYGQQLHTTQQAAPDLRTPAHEVTLPAATGTELRSTAAPLIGANVQAATPMPAVIDQYGEAAATLPAKQSAAEEEDAKDAK